MKVLRVPGLKDYATFRGEGAETVFTVVEGPLEGREFRVTAASGAKAIEAFVAWVKAQ